ncbi:hypothetical protein GCM10009625_01200 [Brachybacterium fresconis]
MLANPRFTSRFAIFSGFSAAESCAVGSEVSFTIWDLLSRGPSLAPEALRRGVDGKTVPVSAPDDGLTNQLRALPYSYE